ncbi:MAG: flavin reductase [Anaerolineaceae bacterium]|nr:flavin reductase [Anaerolineaceae bacterium]
MTTFNRKSMPFFHKNGLLTSGDFQKNHFNTMTIEWGSIGKVWGIPLVQIFVRPSRYTYQFLEQYNSSTLSCFPEEYRKALLLLGTKSGRDGNKITEAGLTPIAANHVASPIFNEAELTIECQKMYWDDIVSAQMSDGEAISRFGRLPEPHRVYYGKIVAIQGIKRYLAAA